MEKRKVKINIGNGTPMISKKQNRNQLCECGSGMKQKICCGVKTKYFDSGLPRKKKLDYLEEIIRND